MTNLVPMAGLGKRFSDEGYRLPKPLIPVSGRPMIAQAIRSMPYDKDWVFVCRKEHIEKYHVDRILRDEAPSCKIISIDKTTEGQASTCLLAKDAIDMDKPLFIGACDNGMVFDRERWRNLTSDKSIDAIILTFTKQPNLTRNPKAWGWVANDKGVVQRISVKVPVSDSPFNDHAVVGSFWFRTGRIFVDAAEQMIAANKRTNNEFYVDSVPMEIIANSEKVVIFDLEQYIGWGTPVDLREYEHWENVFMNGRETEEDRKSDFYGFWKDYFTKNMIR
ncbi:MAG: glycosyltransferase family 2 protein [Candidatus Aenigmarchaeota archaeon]|nr:glycosyltransferase family 2 protein [Candidatus Aenigmarchaeota archaeon]